MADVARDLGLCIGQRFPTRQKLQLRIGEVCQNLHKIPRWTPRTDDGATNRACANNSWICARAWGDNDPFIVKAAPRSGAWEILEANLSEAAGTNSIGTVPHKRCPFTAKQLVPLIAEALSNDPSMGATSMKNHLKCHVRTDCLGDSMLQTVREQARVLVFGDPKTNIQYMEHVIDLATEKGHRAKIITMSREEAKELVVRIARWEHQKKRQSSSEKSFPRFSSQVWQAKNMDRVRELLGDDPEMRYVRGVYFAPSTSVPKFSTFLKLFSADAADLRWGSCTLYSMYGRNLNMGSVCLAHAIIAGNEDKRGWTSFFNFIMDHYPDIDHPSITIVSDRDKG